MTDLGQFEKYWNPNKLTTALRCKLCGATSEISDFEMASAIHIELSHECRRLESGRAFLKLEKLEEP